MKNETNEINLQDELLLKVDGVEEKGHSISWELLKKIGDNTQKLIDILVKVSSEDNKLPVEFTKLAFVGFYKGSAIASFNLPNPQNQLFPVEKELKKLNSDFEFILKNLAAENYQGIADNYNNPSIKNSVINAVYNFSNAAGSKPFSVVKRIGNENDTFKEVRKIKKMSNTIKKKLYIQETPLINKINENLIEVVAKAEIYKNNKGKLLPQKLQFYTEENAALSIKIDLIETEKRIYILKGYQNFSLTTPDNTSFLIENDLLDIYAFGTTFKEAEEDFFNQFDYTYQRLTQIEDSNLSNHLLQAKKFILIIVNQVKEK